MAERGNHLRRGPLKTRIETPYKKTIIKLAAVVKHVQAIRKLMDLNQRTWLEFHGESRLLYRRMGGICAVILSGTKQRRTSKNTERILQTKHFPHGSSPRAHAKQSCNDSIPN